MNLPGFSIVMTGAPPRPRRPRRRPPLPAGAQEDQPGFACAHMIADAAAAGGAVDGRRATDAAEAGRATGGGRRGRVGRSGGSRGRARPSERVIPATAAWVDDRRARSLEFLSRDACRYRLGVRTRGSQPRDRGSNPRTGTSPHRQPRRHEPAGLLCFRQRFLVAAFRLRLGAALRPPDFAPPAAFFAPAFFPPAVFSSHRALLSSRRFARAAC